MFAGEAFWPDALATRGHCQAQRPKADGDGKPFEARRARDGQCAHFKGMDLAR